MANLDRERSNGAWLIQLALNKPLSATVSYKSSGVEGGSYKYDVQTQSVCYTIPTPMVSPIDGYNVADNSYCVKLPK